MRGRTLLELLQALIERTYQMDTGVRDIHRFVVGDRGLRRVYAGRRIVYAPGAAAWPEARVLVREEREGVYVNIYYPDALIAALEAKNPLHGLDARNLDAFAVFVEELDHFLTLADRTRAGRAVSLFELELHANVTKYVACRHFLERSLGRPLAAGERLWLRWSLFEKLEPPPEPPELRARYRDADRLGRRYALRLDRLPRAERVRELRAFHRLSAPGAVRRIEGDLGVHTPT